MVSRLCVFLLHQTGVFQQSPPWYVPLPDGEETKPVPEEMQQLQSQPEVTSERLREMEERLHEAQEMLQRERETARRLWEQNCRKLQDLDAALADKEEQLAELTTRLAQPQTTYAAPVAHNLSHSLSVSSFSLPQLTPHPAAALVGGPQLSRRASPEPEQPGRDAGAARPGARVRRRGKALPVEPYTGEDESIQLDDWLPTLERAGQWNDWAAEELLLQLAGHLRGRALQEWNLLSTEERSTWDAAVTALKRRLEPRSRALAAQDFRHTVQAAGESVSNFITRLERTFQLAYGRDGMSCTTRETFLHSQLQEGLLYKLMKSPAVSGAQRYTELCLAARNEEKRQDELEKRRQYLEKTGNLQALGKGTKSISAAIS